MQFFKPYTLNLGGRLLSVDSPLVMGILNTTPDSFYAGSRCDSEELIRNRIRTIVSQGADIIDIGGYSSRPNADDITPEEEFRRLSLGLRLIKEEAPDSIVSVDTFRASVAERCVGEYGVDIINDIASGGLDPQMIPTVAHDDTAYRLYRRDSRRCGLARRKSQGSRAGGHYRHHRRPGIRIQQDSGAEL